MNKNVESAIVNSIFWLGVLAILVCAVRGFVAFAKDLW